MFIKLLLIVDEVCVVVLSPVTFGLATATHVKVEGTLAVIGIEKACPLQITALFALLITGPSDLTALKSVDGSC